jgi:hypothetical protein
MGDRQNKEMYITKWAKGEISNFKKHWFLFGVLMFCISGSSAISYYEAKPLYNYIKTEFFYSTKFIQIRANQGSDSESLPNPAAESIEVKNSTERETSPEASAPTILKVVEAIHKVETNHGTDLSGLHGKCVAQGKDNSYSYSPGKCYENEEATKKIVIDWFKRKTKDYTMEEALNLYGCGKISDCGYSQVILNLI